MENYGITNVQKICYWFAVSGKEKRVDSLFYKFSSKAFAQNLSCQDKEKGDMGSPCLRLLLEGNEPLATAFKRIEIFEFFRPLATKLRKFP